MLLALLSLLVLAASASIVARLGLESRAERALACTILWNALVLAPIHVLGVTGHLTRTNLVLLSVVTSGLTIAATFSGVDRKGHARAITREVESFARLPFDAVATCVRARSFAAVGVVMAIVVVVWTAWLSYLLPSESWDGTWYHELMVGFAIQNHGYAVADLPRGIGYPMDMIQQANGYPRNCEMTWTWFVMLLDGRLIEVTNSLMVAPLALATYVMARRFSSDRPLAMGWASAIVLVPSVALQLRSTYMDVHVAALHVAAICWATRIELRLRDAWIGLVALALLVGAKSHALIYVPVLFSILIGRLAWQARKRMRLVIATALGGGVLILAVASITYLRNWMAFHNPLWPMTFDSESLGVHWKGLATLDQFTGNKPPAEMWKGATSFRTPGTDFADTGDWAWGWTTPFFLFPLSLIAVLVAIVGSFHGEDRTRARNVLVVVIPLAITVYTAHTLWHPRYNLHLLAGMMVLVHFLLASRAPRVIEGLAGATVFGNLLFLFWAKPAWGADLEEARRVARMSVDERQGAYTLGWSPTPQAAIARERELGEGAVVVFSDEMMFPAYLWNRTFSNRIQYIPRMPADAWIARAEELHATWAVAGEGSAVFGVLASRPEWQRVGIIARSGNCVAFRRLR